MKDYASFEVRPLPNEASVTSNRPARLQVCGNGIGNLEVTASLDFFHFQQIGWK